MKLKFVFFLLLILFSSIFKVLPQSQELQKPLSITQVEALIKNTDKSVSRELQDKANLYEIEKRGVDFQITDEILTRLKNIGAGTKTINALIKIKDIQVNTPRKKLSNKITILVAKFSEQNEQSDNVTDLVISQLSDSTKKYPNISVLPLNEHISAQDGKTVALDKGKAKDADIVVWGWYKKSKTTVIINYQFEILYDLSAFSFDFLTNASKTLIEEVQNFDNFSAPLRMSKEISALTLVTLAIINYNLSNFDDSIRYITDAISQESFSNKFISLSDLYLLRASLYLEKSCGLHNEQSLLDLDNAINLKKDPNSVEILRILAFSNLYVNSKKALEYSEKYYQKAKTDEDKTLSMFLLAMLYAEAEDEAQAKNFARKLSNHLLVIRPNFENYIYLAFASLILEDKSKATLYLDKAKNSVDPNSPQLYRIYFLQGVLYKEDESYELAIENLKKCIQIKPCVGSYLLLAETYEENSDLDMALTIYNQALEINSEMPSIYIGKGRIWEKKEDFERAMANFQKAIEIDSNSIEAHRALADFYKNRNKIEEAIASYSKLLSINKQDDNALQSRAELYLKSDKFDLAVADYRTLFPILAQKPDKFFIDNKPLEGYEIKSLFRRLIRVFYDWGKYEVGIEFSDKIIQYFPKDTLGYESRAIFLEIKGNIPSAIESLSQAIRLKSDDPSYYLQRASLWDKKGNFDEALEDIDQAIRLNGEDEAALEQRAKFYLRIDKFDLALKDFLSSLKLRARKKTRLSELNVRILLMNLESEFEKREKYEQGVEFSNEYLKLFPNDDSGYKFRASFLEKTGNLPKALEDINQAIKLKPSEANYYATRSTIYEKSGDIKAAIENLEKAVELSPDNLRKEIYQSMLNSLKLKNK